MPYITINDSVSGPIKYKKIGDLTADELTGALVDKRVKVIDPATNSVDYISNYDLFNVPENNAAAEFSGDKRARNGVDLYKVKYSINNKGREDVVTGLLAVPVGIGSRNMPLLSWHHGTTFTANEAPTGIMKDDQLQTKPPGSVLEGQIRSTETFFNVYRFAGNGYAVVAADYNGLGDSRTPQYYAIDKPTTKATSGLIQAGKTVLEKLDIGTTELYMNGWSQGALNTLFLEKKFEKEGVPVQKTAHSSTFSSLTASINYWVNGFEGDPFWMTTCLPLVLGSYQEYYNIDGLMEKAIKPKYLRISERIYEGKVNWDQVSGPEKPGEGLLGLPTTGKEMLKSEFRREVREERGEFFRRVKQNEPITQTFSHPSRFYGGGKDTVIPPGYSVDKPVELLSPLATGTWIGDTATHRSAYLGSMFGSAANPQQDIYTWFAEQ